MSFLGILLLSLFTVIVALSFSRPGFHLDCQNTRDDPAGRAGLVLRGGVRGG